ncbi:MAG: glycine cleavage T C-terminal barrel domain-containing protein [Blastocatellia bacterium]|nr:glycine cleavage T C-terminal barrel domain-containing protein [Blastocatellia bacterium]
MMMNTDELRAGYEAIRRSAGIIDFSTAGKLRVSGRNAVQFLNGLVSNDVKTLAAGQGVLAAFPTLQGKLAALARIYNTGEALLMELDAVNREKIFKNLSRFVPAGEFFLEDESDRFALLSVQGPRAAELLGAVAGVALAEAAPYAITAATIAEVPVRIARHSRCGEAGFDLFVPAEERDKALAALLAAGEPMGAREAGPEAFEVARIEAGAPREGVDAGEEYIILESELEAAVSYTKGCYLGQEVIARIHWRGQPARRLRGLLIEGAEPPAAGTELWAADGKKVGVVTSSVRSLALDRPIALGYVHRYHLTVGTEFTLKRGEVECGRARLIDLPFISPPASQPTPGA